MEAARGRHSAVEIRAIACVRIWRQQVIVVSRKMEGPIVLVAHIPEERSSIRTGISEGGSCGAHRDHCGRIDQRVWHGAVVNHVPGNNSGGAVGLAGALPQAAL